MHRTFWFVLLVLGLSVSEVSAQKPNWMSDLNAARQQARKTGKPLFVVFRCEH